METKVVEKDDLNNESCNNKRVVKRGIASNRNSTERVDCKSQQGTRSNMRSPGSYRNNPYEHSSSICSSNFTSRVISPLSRPQNSPVMLPQSFTFPKNPLLNLSDSASSNTSSMIRESSISPNQYKPLVLVNTSNNNNNDTNCSIGANAAQEMFGALPLDEGTMSSFNNQDELNNSGMCLKEATTTTSKASIPIGLESKARGVISDNGSFDISRSANHQLNEDLKMQESVKSITRSPDLGDALYTNGSYGPVPQSRLNHNNAFSDISVFYSNKCDYNTPPTKGITNTPTLTHAGGNNNEFTNRSTYPTPNNSINKWRAPANNYYGEYISPHQPPGVIQTRYGPNTPPLSYDSFENSGGNLNVQRKNNNTTMSVNEQFSASPVMYKDMLAVADKLLEMSKTKAGSEFIQYAINESNPETNENLKLAAEKLFPHIFELLFDERSIYIIVKIMERMLPEDYNTLVEYISKDEEFLFYLCTRSIHTRKIVIHLLKTNECKKLVEVLITRAREIACDQQGCIIMQNSLDIKSGKVKQRLREEVYKYFNEFSLDAYANYVIQYVIEKDDVDECSERVIEKIKGKVAQLSCDKFASNVIEKCLSKLNNSAKHAIIDELYNLDENNFLQLLQDRFGNYSIQSSIFLCPDEDFSLVRSKLLKVVGKTLYGHKLARAIDLRMKSKTGVVHTKLKISSNATTNFNNSGKKNTGGGNQRRIKGANCYLSEIGGSPITKSKFYATGDEWLWGKKSMKRNGPQPYLNTERGPVSWNVFGNGGSVFKTSQQNDNNNDVSLENVQSEQIHGGFNNDNNENDINHNIVKFLPGNEYGGEEPW